MNVTNPNLHCVSMNVINVTPHTVCMNVINLTSQVLQFQSQQSYLNKAVPSAAVLFVYMDRAHGLPVRPPTHNSFLLSLCTDGVQVFYHTTIYSFTTAIYLCFVVLLHSDWFYKW